MDGLDVPDGDRRLTVTEVVERQVQALTHEVPKLLAGIPQTDDPPSTVHRPGEPEPIARRRTSRLVPRLRQRFIERGASAGHLNHYQDRHQLLPSEESTTGYRGDHAGPPR